MYKAVFIDIDGTLLNSQKQISNKTKEIIKSVTEKGILVVLCSGRPRNFTENISREANASKYIITSNGSGIYDYEEDKVLAINSMNKQECIELYKITEAIDAKFIMNVGATRIVNKLTHFDGTEEKLKVPIEEFVEKNNIEQCVIEDKDFGKMKYIKPKIEKLQKVAIKNQHKSLIDKSVPKQGSTIYYDVASVESDKGHAIKKICEILEIDLEDTVAIGDDYNDLSMFKVVGHSIAMGNANEDIKAEADEVTVSNDEDGVALFLEKLLNDKK